MILSKAVANAEMNLAGTAEVTVVCSNAANGTAAAYRAIALLLHTFAEVLAGQRMSGVQTRSTLAWCVLGRQLLQELMHELLAEAKLAAMPLPF